MASQSHLAGGPVHVDSRYLRQLCQWCGHRLVDMDLHNVATPVETAMSTTAKFPWPEWEVGAWIRVDGGLSVVVEMEKGKMPPDSCMRDVSPLLKAVPAIEGDRRVDDTWTACGRCGAHFPTASTCANHGPPVPDPGA